MPLHQPIHRAIPRIQQQRQLPIQVPILQVVCYFVFSSESNFFFFILLLSSSGKFWSGTSGLYATMDWILPVTWTKWFSWTNRSANERSLLFSFVFHSKRNLCHLERWSQRFKTCSNRNNTSCISKCNNDVVSRCLGCLCTTMGNE